MKLKVPDLVIKPKEKIIVKFKIRKMNTNTENLKAYFYTDLVVREDKSLKDISKLIFSDIAYFQYLRDRRCTASNPYFAKKYGKSNGTISKAISDLESKGYIERFLDSHKNRTIYVRRSKFASSPKDATSPNNNIPDLLTKDPSTDKSDARASIISQAEIDDLIDNAFPNE